MVDISAGLHAQLETALTRAQSLYQEGQREAAAQEYERCARIMKELVPDAVSPSVQRQRLEKARQYLELSKRLRAGEAVAITAQERAEFRGRPRETARGSNAEQEQKEEFSSAVLDLVQRTTVTWEQIGGLDGTKRDIRAAYALSTARLPRGVRLKTSQNILLYGPPGTGKTLLAAAASNELSATFFNVKTSGLLSKYFGESSKLMSALFAEARKHAPALLFFDEVDALAPARSGNIDGAEKRVLSTLLSEMDGLESKNKSGFLYVMGATNAPWDLDPAILSRFGKLVLVPLPDAAARADILGIHMERNGFSCCVPREELVRKTDGYSGRDLERLCAEATQIMALNANPHLLNASADANRSGGELRIRPIEQKEFEEALQRIRPKTNPESAFRYAQWATDPRI